jgi:regulation of enolase protein 1 (concanavalin A-like superfamily)
VTSASPSIAQLPQLAWQGRPAASSYDVEAGRLSITAEAGSDWFNDPVTGVCTDSAAALLFVPTGDFSLSARVRVRFAGTFDAGVLCLWQSPAQWAKLCWEHSPRQESMVVSVVTRGSSDDANAQVLQSESVYLRVLRTGSAYAFHCSLDGSTWDFVRLFRLDHGGAPVRVGFLAQAPDTVQCTSTFEEITLSTTVPADLRNGS